jgi:hypothetical protein
LHASHLRCVARQIADSTIRHARTAIIYDLTCSNELRISDPAAQILRGSCAERATRPRFEDCFEIL